MSRKKKGRKNGKAARAKTVRSSKPPFLVEDQLGQAVKCYKSNRFRKAEKICKKILKTNSDNPRVLYMLGLTIHQLGDTKMAVNLFRQCIHHDPGTPWYHYSLGTALQEMGKLEEAISCHQKALSIKPKFAEAYNNMGNAFRDQDKLDEALECYQKALAIKPDWAETYNNMGNALKDQGKLDRAIACYQKALAIKPNFAEAYNKMGLSFQGLGRLDSAILSYRKAVELQPDNASAYCNMGNVLEIQGKIDEAIVSLQRASELDPTNLSVKHQLAALTGVTTKTAPPEYISGLFDYNAKWFEERLVQKLEYNIPRLLRQSLNRFTGDKSAFRNAVDLGCGTGLSGMEFRAISDRLTGIDISVEMLKQAKSKGIYDALHAFEIVDFLKSTVEKYDLFIAADVFIYVGDLEPVFMSIRDCSLNEALFVFSTESCDGKHYILRPTGRYAHTRAYVEELAKGCGYEIGLCSQERIRKEDGKEGENVPWVMGDLFVLQCPST